MKNKKALDKFFDSPNVKRLVNAPIDHTINNTKPQHTPTPWKLGEEANAWKEREILAQPLKSEPWHHITQPMKATDAAFIVRAVNQHDGLVRENAAMRLAHEEMLEALKEAQKIISTAREYFPKSIKNTDRFNLENTCACIGTAIAKAEGR